MVTCVQTFNGDMCTSFQWWHVYKLSMVTCVHTFNGDMCTSVQWWHVYKLSMVTCVQTFNGDMCTNFQWWHVYKLSMVTCVQALHVLFITNHNIVPYFPEWNLIKVILQIRFIMCSLKVITFIIMHRIYNLSMKAIWIK